MANPTRTFGLRKVKTKGAAHSSLTLYYIPSSDSNAYYIGQPVVKTGDSNSTVLRGAGGLGHQIGSIQRVEAATLATANPITGVIVGFQPRIDRPGVRYGEASTERLVLVDDDPNSLFEIRDDGAAALGVGVVGLNANLITGTSSTLTGFSGIGLDSAGDVPAADSADQLLIVGAAPIDNNDATLASCVWRVKINNHTEKDSVAGIA